MDRRDFLKQSSILGAAGLFFPNILLAKDKGKHERTLGFYNTNTNERVTATYWADGDYVYEELDKINWIMRDFRQNIIVNVDHRLINGLYYIHNRMGLKHDYALNSGYRTEETNQYLSQFYAVAEDSFHLKAMASDISMKNYDIQTIHKEFVRAQFGGVGLYSKSNFIHVDSGPVRQWYT
jgi:uncharacterized protein YcbK (DUF882 family)